MADKKDVLDPANLTLTQESELNAKAASLESFDQKMAFETYYKLGNGRTYVKVAGQVGRAERTVRRWAEDFRWPERVRERERQAAEFLLMQKSAEEEAKTKEKHLTLIDATVSQWSKKLLEGGIKLRSVEDLERLIRLRWDISGIPEKRVSASGATGGGGMIDLRLRNMNREELQKFLHGTMASISRIMDKRPLKAPGSGGDEKMSMDLRVELGEAAPQTKDVTPDTIEVQGVHIDEPVDFGSESDDLDLNLDDITDL